MTTVWFSLARPGMPLWCVCERERDRQGGTVGDVAGQGRGRGQTGWTKVTPTACVCVRVCPLVHPSTADDVSSFLSLFLTVLSLLVCFSPLFLDRFGQFVGQNKQQNVS